MFSKIACISIYKNGKKTTPDLYLGSLLLLHDCKSYGFRICLTVGLSTRERWGGGSNVSQTSADELETLVQDGQSVVAAVGHGGGRADALPQAIPGIFHDAKRAQRQTWKRHRTVRVLYLI